MQLMPAIDEARANLLELHIVTLALEHSVEDSVESQEHRAALFNGREMQQDSILRFALPVRGADKTSSYWVECTGPKLSEEGQLGYICTASLF